MNNYSSIIHNNQKVETNQMFINSLIYKQNVVYPYNGVLLNNIKEWNNDTL